MELISTVTVGAGGASSIDFTSIPATYTDLMILLSARGNFASTSGDLNMTFNGNALNYGFRNLRGTGSTTASANASSQSYMAAYSVLNQDSSTASTFSNVQIYIPNYTGSLYKIASIDGVSENNATAAGQSITADLWSDTGSSAAISSISMTVYTAWKQYTTASLYGILKGSGGATVS